MGFQYVKFDKRLVAFAFLSYFVSFPIAAQLTPPGLDGARAVGWAAIGASQSISEKLSTTIYIGGSGQSDPVNFSALKKPAIFVVNQETLYQFTQHWQLALGTSLRYQYVYEEDEPYDFKDPEYRKEIRYYLRLFYREQRGRVNWTYSFRPEYRSFYTPEWSDWPTPVEMRFRANIQASIPLNASKTNFFIAANEWLTATDEDKQTHWTSLQFTEDRFSTFFRHAFKKPAVFLDIGLMHQLWKDKEKNLKYTTYLSFDLLFQNPLSKINKP